LEILSSCVAAAATNCFSSNGGSSQNDSLPRYRSDLDQFFNDTTQLRECFANYSSASSNQSGPSIVCDKCSSLYSALTIRFDTLSNAEHTRDRNTHSLCMDAVDAMNATHRLWSEAYQCDSRVRSLQPLPLIIAGYLTAVLFYIGARGRGQFKQRKLLRQKRLGCFASSSGAVSGFSFRSLLPQLPKSFINRVLKKTMFTRNGALVLLFSSSFCFGSASCERLRDLPQLLQVLPQALLCLRSSIQRHPSGWLFSQQPAARQRPFPLIFAADTLRPSLLVLYSESERDFHVRLCRKTGDSACPNDRLSAYRGKRRRQLLRPAGLPSMECRRHSAALLDWSFPVALLMHFCGPMGDLSLVWTASSTAMPTNTVRAPASVMLILARLDSFSMFASNSPASGTLTPAIAVLLAVANALASSSNGTTGRDVAIVFVNGDSWDYIGSQRLLAAYTDPSVYRVVNSTVDSHVKSLGLKSDALISDRKLPPASTQTFSKAARFEGVSSAAAGAACLTAHRYERDQGFRNRNYNSFADLAPDALWCCANLGHLSGSALLLWRHSFSLIRQQQSSDYNAWSGSGDFSTWTESQWETPTVAGCLCGPPGLGARRNLLFGVAVLLLSLQFVLGAPSTAWRPTF
uniref:Sulfatase domain-containing protein n=1 Tax=Macrostomum lignano TaxID=282301 RepID=A0A1I8FHG2_9PLAT